MDLVKLGKKGQVSIPTSILKKLGLEGGQHLIVEASEDGAILLRPASIYPIEIYTDERMAEFEKEGRMTEAERERVDRLLARLDRR
jgi:AbrB family looped-hinge helix DNA binding protein